MPLPGYTWDARALQYRGPTGRFISRRDVRGALDVALKAENRRMRELTLALQRSEINAAEWYLDMRKAIKEVHLMSAALGKGGFGQMTPADYGRVGRILRFQYQHLEHFSVQIVAGLPIDGRAFQRVEMYFEAGRRTYHLTERAAFKEAGFDEERSVLHPADHCDLCVSESERGWQPIGTVIPIGERTCLSRCKCSMEYRQTGQGGDDGDDE